MRRSLAVGAAGTTLAVGGVRSTTRSSHGRWTKSSPSASTPSARRSRSRSRSSGWRLPRRCCRTDGAVAQFGPDITDPSADTAEEVREALEGQLLGTPIPGEEPAAEPSVLEGPRGVRVLADGRVGGIWGIEGDEAFLILAEEDGRWLIDAFVDIIETDAAPAVATPAT